jgi:hypothetical protein
LPSSAKRGDRLGLRHLMGKHIPERAEFADFELTVAHRLYLGVVTGRNKDFDLAAELLSDQLSELLVDRDQASRRVVGLDAKAHRAAIGAIIRLRRHRRGGARQHQRNPAGHDPKSPAHSSLSVK